MKLANKLSKTDELAYKRELTKQQQIDSELAMSLHNNPTPVKQKK